MNGRAHTNHLLELTLIWLHPCFECNKISVCLFLVCSVFVWGVRYRWKLRRGHGKGKNDVCHIWLVWRWPWLVSFDGVKYHCFLNAATLSLTSHIFCSIIGEIPRSVSFVRTTMERIGLGAMVVASFSMQVVWMCLSRRRLHNISPAVRAASCQNK